MKSAATPFIPREALLVTAVKSLAVDVEFDDFAEFGPAFWLPSGKEPLRSYVAGREVLLGGPGGLFLYPTLFWARGVANDGGLMGALQLPTRKNPDVSLAAYDDTPDGLYIAFYDYGEPTESKVYLLILDGQVAVLPEESGMALARAAFGGQG